MAKMLFEQGNGSYVMEMTQDDWNKIHKDFKSEPGESMSCMALTEHGSTLVPVKIVTSQNLARTMAKPFTSPHNMTKLAIGQPVTIKEQTYRHVYVTDEQGNQFTLTEGHFNQ